MSQKKEQVLSTVINHPQHKVDLICQKRINNQGDETITAYGFRRWRSDNKKTEQHTIWLNPATLGQLTHSLHDLDLDVQQMENKKHSRRLQEATELVHGLSSPPQKRAA